MRTTNQPLKRSPRTDLNNTLLALQILAGVKLYTVRIAGSTHVYSYKSREELAVDTPVIVQTNKTFVVGIVVEEVKDFDYALVTEWRWVLQSLPENPETKQNEFATLDLEAKKKLAQARALNEAKKILEVSGLSLSDLGLLGLPVVGDATRD